MKVGCFVDQQEAKDIRATKSEKVHCVCSIDPARPLKKYRDEVHGQ